MSFAHSISTRSSSVMENICFPHNSFHIGSRHRLLQVWLPVFFDIRIFMMAGYNKIQKNWSGVESGLNTLVSPIVRFRVETLDVCSTERFWTFDMQWRSLIRCFIIIISQPYLEVTGTTKWYIRLSTLPNSIKNEPASTGYASLARVPPRLAHKKSRNGCRRGQPSLHKVPCEYLSISSNT